LLLTLATGRTRNRYRASVLGLCRRARPTGGRPGCDGGRKQREVDARGLAGDDRASVLGDGYRARTSSPLPRVPPPSRRRPSSEPASASLPATECAPPAAHALAGPRASSGFVGWHRDALALQAVPAADIHSTHSVLAAQDVPRRPGLMEQHGGGEHHLESSAPVRRPRYGAPVGDQTGRA
jgi:hypothetical protein